MSRVIGRIVQRVSLRVCLHLSVSVSVCPVMCVSIRGVEAVIVWGFRDSDSTKNLPSQTSKTEVV